MSEYQSLHHVSPDYNTDNILKAGILPNFSRGARKTIWLVNEDNLVWAIAHVSDRWKVPVSCIAVFEVHAPQEVLIRTARAGVYESRQPLKVKRATPAHHFITD
jgi:hypothetical protein